MEYPAERVKTLVVVSHVVHYRHAGQLWAYGPYAREIDIWADLFPAVSIAAPCRDAAPPGDCIPFSRSNIGIEPQVEVGGDTVAAKIRIAAALPSMVVRLCRALVRADAVHVRCPGGLGLMGVILAPLFSRHLVAKYAGQWNGFDGEPWTGRLERRLLRSRWWRGPVTVYGDWPEEPAHIVPFFTSMMTTEQITGASEGVGRKQLGQPLRVLYSGVLEPRKRVNVLLEAVAIALDQGLGVEVAVVGDGPQRAALGEQAARLGIESSVTFVGPLPFDRALDWYRWAHCLVLPSRHSEGWPKVVAEAMTHGVLCLAVAHGQVPAMLRDDRGILLEDGSPEEIAAALVRTAGNPAAYETTTRRAAQWASGYSLEGLRWALAALLNERWDLPAPLSVAGTKAI